MRRVLSLVCGLVLIGGCGGGKPTAVSPEGSEAALANEAEGPAAESSKQAEPVKPAEDEKAGMPTSCAEGTNSELCTPGKKFVDRLCQGNFPSAALVMFRKGTPWARGYLTRKTKAWNASGGASDTEELSFDEEVIVLRHRAAPKGGIQVSGAGGGYDALRWNGSCVTLAKEELTLRHPPRAKTAKVEWRFLDDGIRESLRASDVVTKAYRARRKECKGATMGTVSKKCVKADAKLSRVIVDFVRSGAELAVPEKHP